MNSDLAKNVDVDAIIANLSGEFVEDCLDNVEEAEKALANMQNGQGDFKNQYDNLQRHVHSIKGTAGTFGFPAIGVFAHRLEDFIEALKDVSPHLDKIQIFLDKIREIAESGHNPEGEDYIRLVRSLPRAHNRIAAVRPTREVNILLVMPRDIQRKIIGQELSSCGFGMSFVASGVDAISSVLSMKPDVVISSNFLEDMSGADLARTLSAIKATRGINFALISSDEFDDVKKIDIPDGVVIIKKEVDYTETLSKHLVAWGLFG
ncbi:MAG: Hpt domain-containing protein [Rhodospirillales bacterium]|nr:Hpt domain-containing protein [Rhodospirillales bacterium]